MTTTELPRQNAPSPDQCLRTLRRGLLLGNQAVVAAVEEDGIRVHLPEPGRWYDTRPMLDEREHAPQVIDMAREALDYGCEVGLLRQHSAHPHLVCIVEQPEVAA